MDKNLDKEISKIANYINNQISNEKFALGCEIEKLEKKRLNIIKRIDSIIDTWEIRLKKQKEKENITIITALNEGALEAMLTAKKIVNDEFGLD